MEVGDIPKTTETVGSKTPVEEKKELEQKASELARAIKENGIVNMFLGQRLSRESPPIVASFIQGVSVDQLSRKKAGSPWVNETYGMLSDMLPPHDFTSRSPYGYRILGPGTQRDTNRQIWKIAKYAPPIRQDWVEKTVDVKTKRFGFIPKTERHVEGMFQPSKDPLSYDGKRGESDWTQYDYYMPRYDKGDDRTDGQSAVLSVAVPPHIATQIDAEVTRDSYFPDALLKALYPGYVGSDIDRNLKRFPATELQVADCRTKPEKSNVLEYPQPLPY